MRFPPINLWSIPKQRRDYQMTDSALKTQVGGSHYKDCKIQPIEFIHANGLDFLRGNVVKYVTRRKNGAEDIRKAIHYCQLLLELEYGE
jgi:hypothetical protein